MLTTQLPLSLSPISLCTSPNSPGSVSRYTRWLVRPVLVSAYTPSASGFAAGACRVPAVFVSYVDSARKASRSWESEACAFSTNPTQRSRPERGRVFLGITHTRVLVVLSSRLVVLSLAPCWMGRRTMWVRAMSFTEEGVSMLTRGRKKK